MAAGAPRVVMVISNFHPYVGGAERQSLELSKALKAMGLEITVLTRRHFNDGLPAGEDVEGIRVRRLCVWGWSLFVDSLLFMIRSFVWLCRHAGDCLAIHAHLAGSHALASAAAGKLLKKPVFIKLGGGAGIGELAASHDTRAGRLKLKLLKWVPPTSFVAVTGDLVEELKRYGLGNASVEVVPNGVDTRRFHPVSAEEKALCRGRMGWPATAPCFLYVGRLAPEKQLETFLGVFAEALRDAGADAWFSLIGQGPERGALWEAHQRIGLQAHVRFQHAAPRIEWAYRAADVFVLPSISEGLSNALLEAMASGLAVLASRVGGTREAVLEGNHGLLFDPRDRAGMKAQLLRFLREPGLAAGMGARARAKAESDFDISAVARRYRELYGS